VIKEARIRRLGDTPTGITDALAGADVTELPQEKLSEFK